MGDALARARNLERQFLLSVSHELRTPLTSIRGYADAVADGATDDVRGAVAVIGAEARRLERLVEDLLDLARLDAKRFSLKPTLVDCVDVVAGVADGFRPEAEAAGLQIVTALPEAPGTALLVTADPDRLAQIVANLVENAFKHADRRIVVGAERDNGWCALSVVDDGPGIAPADLPHVFERHFRADPPPPPAPGSASPSCRSWRPPWGRRPRPSPRSPTGAARAWWCGSVRTRAASRRHGPRTAEPAGSGERQRYDLGRPADDVDGPAGLDLAVHGGEGDRPPRRTDQADELTAPTGSPSTVTSAPSGGTPAPSGRPPSKRSPRRRRGTLPPRASIRATSSCPV